MIENHYSQKEYRDDIILEIEGRFYEIYFFIDGVLKYEMTKDGYFAFPGMIILDEISTERIINSIKKLFEYDYFKSFKGYENFPINGRFMNRWYLNGENAFSANNIDKIELSLL